MTMGERERERGEREREGKRESERERVYVCVWPGLGVKRVKFFAEILLSQKNEKKFSWLRSGSPSRL